MRQGGSQLRPRRDQKTHAIPAGTALQETPSARQQAAQIAAALLIVNNYHSPEHTGVDHAEGQQVEGSQQAHGRRYKQHGTCNDIGWDTCGREGKAREAGAADQLQLPCQWRCMHGAKSTHLTSGMRRAHACHAQLPAEPHSAHLWRRCSRSMGTAASRHRRCSSAPCPASLRGWGARQHCLGGMMHSKKCPFVHLQSHHLSPQPTAAAYSCSHHRPCRTRCAASGGPCATSASRRKGASPAAGPGATAGRSRHSTAGTAGRPIVGQVWPESATRGRHAAHLKCKKAAFLAARPSKQLDLAPLTSPEARAGDLGLAGGGLPPDASALRGARGVRMGLGGGDVAWCAAKRAVTRAVVACQEDAQGGCK